MATTVLMPKHESAGRTRRGGTDARRRKRLQISLPVQVRPFDPRFSELVDVGEVADFTRDGLYFITFMPHYFVGMRIHVTFPFGDRVKAHRNFLGKVVRLEERDDKGGSGIAVSFLI